LRHFYDLDVDTADGSSLSMYADTWVPKFVSVLRDWKDTSDSTPPVTAVS
jgi:hypothetical protein